MKLRWDVRVRLACCVAVICSFGIAGDVSRASETVTYGYDALGRLTSVSRSGGPSSAFPIVTNYDPAGNRTNYNVANAPSSSPGPVSFSVINAPAVNEGANAVFTVTKTGATASTQSVNYGTASGSGTSGSDFTPTSGTLSFLSWETQKTVSVPTIIDNLAEPAETFTMSLTGPSSGATIGTATATGTINASSAPAQPPVANADIVSVGQCDSVSVNVVANDTDPGGNYPLTLVSVGTSNRGTGSVESSTNVYFVAYGTTGSAQMTYTIRNSVGATATGVLAITVTNGTGCM